MRIRGATKADWSTIEKLLVDYEFKLEFKHLQSIVVVEDELGKVFAVGSLQTILEAMFIVDKGRPRRTRVDALKLILDQAEVETNNLGFEGYHAFATNKSIKQILLNKEAKPVNGEVLIKWVKPNG